MINIASRVTLVLAYFIKRAIQFLKEDEVNQISTQSTMMYNWARSFGLAFVILTKKSV